jgi:hypothetical protein
MKRKSISPDRLDQVLRRAHRAKAALPAGSLPIQVVMARIRSRDQDGLHTPWGSFETLVWRLAPATGALALALLGIWMHINLIGDAELFQIFYAEPQMLSLLNF